MADRLGLGNEIRELKIGQSFTNPKSTSFHTVRYDFKPASVDTNKKAKVDVGDNHQVTVTVPHLDGAGTTQTVFKGSQRPYTKECVLIIDRDTGTVTLEKLNCNIQLKKTRSEHAKTPLTQDRSQSANSDRGVNSNLSQRSATPPVPNVVAHRVSSKTRVTSGSRRPDRQITQLMPKHSPLQASPGHPSPNAGVLNQRSPGKSRDIHPNVNNEMYNPSTLASLPMIGMDDFSDPVVPPVISQPTHNRLAGPPIHNINNGKTVSPTYSHSSNENGVGTISDSSSSTTSGSESDSDQRENIKVQNGYSNTSIAKVSERELATLDQDLCLSESGSDDD